MNTKSHLKREISTVILLCACMLSIGFSAFAQTYDPLAVQRINDLIANNGVDAIPNAPETWTFAGWNNATPKQLTGFQLMFGITGYVSLEGLTALNRVLIEDYAVLGLNLANCTGLEQLICYYCKLTKLDVTNCTSLKSLFCYNNHISELVLTDCTQLRSLLCNNNSLTTLDLTNCTQLYELDCRFNNLTELNLTGLDNLPDEVQTSGQNVSLTLVKNETEEYTRTITLNNPTFGNSAISYADGILKSTNTTVTLTSFTVQTGKEGFELSGTMNFTYSNVGISTQEKEQLKVYPNPTTGELTITNYELRITNVEVFDVYGRKQLSTLNSQLSTQIDISHLPTGIYFIKIITEQGAIVKKVVKH